MTDITQGATAVTTLRNIVIWIQSGVSHDNFKTFGFAGGIVIIDLNTID
jgi:hypothetical protein